MSQVLNVQVDEKPDKSELTASLGLNRPLVTGPPHDKKPWLSPPMVPTPLLPLPTLSFTVSQVILLLDNRVKVITYQKSNSAHGNMYLLKTHLL